MKVGCRARGRGWGWRVKRSPEAPLLGVSYGRVEGWKPICVSQCWLTSLSPALPTNTAHCPILPAAWDGQRLGPLHIPWRRVIRGRRSLRRGPRSWAHIFRGAAEMRWAQVQFHGTCEVKVDLLTPCAVTDPFKPQLRQGPQSPTGHAHFIERDTGILGRKHACAQELSVWCLGFRCQCPSSSESSSGESSGRLHAKCP